MWYKITRQNYTLRPISRKVDDSQLGIFNNIKYCLELFNQCIPIYSLCKIKFYVNQIRYEGRLYHVVAMTQSVKATVLVTPQTIRAWLGSEIITEMSLKRLVGKRFELVVVVTGTLKLYNIDRKLFSRMLWNSVVSGDDYLFDYWCF